MKKKIPLLIFIIFTSLLLKNCIMIHIEDQSSIKPTYNFQKTYILKHIPLNFMAYYNVWKYEPFIVSDFTSIKEMKKSKLFTAIQQITFVGNNFFIEDKVNNNKYQLKQELFPTKGDNIINYSIYQSDTIIGTINQIDKNNTLLFLFNYKNNTYIIHGEMNKFQNGAFKLAIKEAVPVLPIALKGTGDAIPKGSWLFSTQVDFSYIPSFMEATSDAKALFHHLRLSPN